MARLRIKLKGIGPFLCEKIKSCFKTEGISVVIRYFDPSYQIRSRPANSEDTLLCDLFARHAVHAAMAGKTGLVTRNALILPAAGGSVLAATGQAAQFD
jgi:hypothetical protein